MNGFFNSLCDATAYAKMLITMFMVSALFAAVALFVGGCLLLAKIWEAIHEDDQPKEGGEE